MKYTKYFVLIIKEQGQINLPPDQFQRMMDIPVILTPHSGHIDPPVDFGLKR